MAPWAFRGLKMGVVTSPYPRRPDDYGPSFRGKVVVAPEGARPEGIPEGVPEAVSSLCPTGAIWAKAGGGVFLDRGRCIVCGRCTLGWPDLFHFESNVETAVLHRNALVVPALEDSEALLERVREELRARVRQLRRSVHVRHVDAGSDGAEEWEVAALINPVYDVQRLGVYFTATPRHADILLVTGAGTQAMRAPLLRTYEAMPEPRVVMAVGTDAVSGGFVQPSYAVLGGIGQILPVDVWVPGSPPSPFSILHGILLAIGLLQDHQP